MLTKLQTFPTIPMKRFGTNLFEEPIFRIVWSDSRTDLAGGKWPENLNLDGVAYLVGLALSPALSQRERGEE